jgi:hypothetical protein
MHRRSTSSRDTGGPATKLGERERGGGSFGQDIEIDGRLLVEGPRRKLPDEVLATDTRQMRPHARDERRVENAKTQEVRQTRPLAGAIEMEPVMRVLAMHIVKRMVRMPLVVERPDAGALESRAEVKLPSKRGLDIESEAPRRITPRRHDGMNVIVRRAERQEATLLALRKEHPSKDPE